MSKVGNILGMEVDLLTYDMCDTFPTRNKVGIELEIEAEGVFEYTTDLFQHWESHNEDSLRGTHTELVLRQPLFGQDLKNALDAFDKWRDDHIKEGVIFIESERTSNHVHIDIRDLEVYQLINLILIYMAVEKILFKVSGQRDSSIYCIPLSSNYSAKEQIFGSFKCIEDTVLLYDAFNMNKYGALNTEAIRTFGSLEFRHHEGTVDSARIIQWVNLLLSLKTYAANTDKLITDFPVHVSTIGPVEFLEGLFKKQFPAITYEEFIIDFFAGIRDAQEIINRGQLYKYSKQMRMKPKVKNKYIDKFKTNMETM